MRELYAILAGFVSETILDPGIEVHRQDELRLGIAELAPGALAEVIFAFRGLMFLRIRAAKWPM
jgi:hypothetical protein